MNLFNTLGKWLKYKFTSESSDIDKDPSLIEYKILVLGERQVGKSSICTRFAINEFNLEIKPTTQSECYTRTVKIYDQLIKIYVVDIEESIMRSGDRNQIYADVKGAILVYDVTKTKTFEKVENWIIDLRQKTSLNIPIILAGNKSDLTFLKNVDYEEGLDKAETLNCEFMETSCVDLNDVKQVFQLLIAKIYFGELNDNKKQLLKEMLLNKENKEEEGEKKIKDY
jgi:small GTP-binding protein